MRSAWHLAGSQVDDVCCALLALSLGTVYLRRVLLACPALLACKPAALTAQAGTQPVPALAACLPCAPAPSALLSCAPDENSVSFFILH